MIPHRRVGVVRALAVAVAAFTLALPAQASSIVARTPAALFERAQRVVYGVVEEVVPHPDGGVEARLRVERLLAADADDAAGAEAVPPTGTLPVRFGREPGDERIADLPVPEVGDRVLLALHGDERALSPVVGFWQGAWTVGPAGLADLRGRHLVNDDGTVRLLAGAPTDPAVGTEVGSLLEVLDQALRGGDAALADALPEAVPDDALPELPAPASDAGEAPDASAQATPAPREVVLALPDDPDVRAAVDAALALWSEAGVALVLRLDPEAGDRVSIREGARLGSDVRALLRRRPDADGVELLLPDGSLGRRPDALAQAIGRLLGLPPAPQGFATGLVPPDERIVPDAAAVAALAARLAARLGDLDGDGDVDLYDLAAVAEAYGREGVALPADLDGSGRVDDADVEALRQRYEFLPPSRQPPPSE
jgi:hypothetical protein